MRYAETGLTYSGHSGIALHVHNLELHAHTHTHLKKRWDESHKNAWQKSSISCQLETVGLNLPGNGWIDDRESRVVFPTFLGLRFITTILFMSPCQMAGDAEENLLPLRYWKHLPSFGQVKLKTRCEIQPGSGFCLSCPYREKIKSSQSASKWIFL